MNRIKTFASPVSTISIVRAQDRLVTSFMLRYFNNITRRKYWSFNFTVLIISDQWGSRVWFTTIRKIGYVLSFPFPFLFFFLSRKMATSINEDLTNISFYRFYSTFNIIFNYIRYCTRQTSFRFKINTWKVILRFWRAISYYHQS